MTDEPREMAPAPIVSVVVPLYNHERYVRECIGSVLGQSFQDFELVVVDDGSTDRSGEIVQGIGDPRIHYVRQENSGTHATINRGVAMARGTYVSILNSDDVYHPDRLAECVAAVGTDGPVAAVFSHVELIDDDGALVRVVRGASDLWMEGVPERTFMGEGNLLLDLLAGNFLCTTSNLFCRRDAFDRIGSFANLRYANDYDFFLRLVSAFPARLIEKPLLRYRVHPGNTLKEDEAVLRFEVGLVLADFMLRGGLERALGERPRDSETMAKFAGSLNPLLPDRVLLTLLVFGAGSPAGREALLGELVNDRDNVFRKAGIAAIRSQIDLQERYKQAVRELGYLEVLRAQLRDQMREAEALRGELRSWSYRLGRFLTWPLRQVADAMNSRRHGS